MKRQIFRAWLLVAMLAALAACGMASAQDKGAGFDDALITELVRTAINNDPMLGKLNISIETLNRVVHLRGVVDSMAQVDRAGALARGVAGVTAVKNAIRMASRPSRA